MLQRKVPAEGIWKSRCLTVTPLQGCGETERERETEIVFCLLMIFNYQPFIYLAGIRLML